MAKKKEESLYLKDLNPEQIEAVIFDNGPLLIVAGAGTGKTAAITKRIAYLIEKELAKSEEILAVTFTDKAAQEMEERVDKLLPFGYLDLWISTFHSFAQRIIEENGLDIGLPNNFKILDDTSAWLLIRKNLSKFDLEYYKPLGNPTKFISAMLDHFSKCKDQGVYPDDYISYWKDFKGDEEEKLRIGEIANAYKTYQDLLLENSYLDFGDLIMYCLKLLKERPNILKKYQGQFKYILVDEFQDTNWAQYELIKLISHPRNNITVCADDDQAIYRWRGASFNNVLQFKKDFPNAKEVVLVKNYRSGQNILDLSYNFIQLNNPNRLEFQLSKQKEIAEQAKQKGLEIKDFKVISKKLTAEIEPLGIIENLHFKSLEEENRGVVQKIEELMKNGSAKSLSDFAILVRSNDAAQSFTKELERRGISHQFLASRGLYTQPVIMDIIAYFKLLDDYHESPAVYRILNAPILNIPYQELAQISYFSKIKTWSLYETLQNLSLVKDISDATKEKIKKFIKLVEDHTNIAKEKNVTNVFINFLNDSKYLFYLVKNDKQKEISLLNQFYKKIKQFEESETDTSLKNFVNLLNLEMESGELGSLDPNLEDGPDSVKLMTIHGAKGLEFPFVFIVNLVDRRFPTDQRKDPIELPEALIKDIMPLGDIHIQEERRLFYVAMTRAKRGLFFCWADDYGGQRKKKPSVFLHELGLVKKETISAQKTLFEPSKAVSKKDPLVTLPSYFSYTQIAAFEKCPLQYKFAHILSIPRAGSPVLSFGKTMHATFQKFIEEVNEFGIEKITLKRLLEIYQNEWIDEWYENKESKEKRFESGKKSLTAFFNDFKEKNPKTLIIDGKPALELAFVLKINGYPIKGQIDRIDVSDKEIEIIDYKTGKAKDKLDKEDKKQLLIYQIAAQEVLKIHPNKLTYYYVDHAKKMSFVPKPEDLDEFKENIEQKIEEMQNSDFSPTPSVLWCKYCDFKDICEFKKLS
jgi:DNA helicase-2/ATP-dependent DNA helicase PcrA